SSQSIMHVHLFALATSLLLASTVLAAPSSAVSHCYHPFLARLDTPTTCSSAKDCIVSNAACVYSLQASAHVCCAPRRDAIQPRCPPPSSPSISDGLPLLCDPTSTNTIEGDDSCPDGFACTESATDFTRVPGAPAFLCCAAL
ncbi:hypothetical protein PFISCL1PPCAC_24666, partial [Pristionchus fissidentatus]